jgi:hypothetical protein
MFQWHALIFNLPYILAYKSRNFGHNLSCILSIRLICGSSNQPKYFVMPTRQEAFPYNSYDSLQLKLVFLEFKLINMAVYVLFNLLFNLEAIKNQRRTVKSSKPKCLLTNSTYTRVSNFGQKTNSKIVIQLICGSTYTRVYTVLLFQMILITTFFSYTMEAA